MAVIDDKLIGSRLRIIRLRHGLTQEAVANTPLVAIDEETVVDTLNTLLPFVWIISMVVRKYQI